MCVCAHVCVGVYASACLVKGRKVGVLYGGDLSDGRVRSTCQQLVETMATG